MKKKEVGTKIAELGYVIVVRDERIKVGLLDKELGGNVRVVERDGKKTATGIFAVTQWFRRGEPLEKIAYNVTANTIDGARTEMETWIPRLQFPEFRETSRLLEIIEYSGSIDYQPRTH